MYLTFVEVDDGLFMADMSEHDNSGIWTINVPHSFYGVNGSEMFDCAIRDNSDNDDMPIKHLGSMETFRKASEFLSFLWRNGKTYEKLESKEYINAPKYYDFSL